MVGAGAETFALLGNETRLRIIEALGDLSERGEFSTVWFSELRTAVGVSDSGTFSYHLRKLTGRFVTSVDEGYRLSLEGINVYRGLRAGIFDPDDHTPVADVAGRRVQLREPCLDCGDPLDVWIERGRIHLGCDTCGSVDMVYPVPAGGLSRAAAAIADDDAETAFSVMRERLLLDKRAMLRGYCAYCSSDVVVEFSDDASRVPEPGDVRLGLVVTLSCSYCHWYVHSNLEAAITDHPRAVLFMESRGIEVTTLRAERDIALDASLHSTDPWRLEATVTLPEERLRLVLDDSLRAVDSSVEPVPPGEAPDGCESTGPVDADSDPIDLDSDPDPDSA